MQWKGTSFNGLFVLGVDDKVMLSKFKTNLFEKGYFKSQLEGFHTPKPKLLANFWTRSSFLVLTYSRPASKIDLRVLPGLRLLITKFCNS